MLRLALIAAALTSIVTLGVAIDARSKIVPSRDAATAGTTGERNRIFAPGIVEGVTENVELRPQLAGRVIEVLVQAGQRVAQGDALLRLDDRDHRQQVELAAAQLEMARAQLQQLENGAHAEERKQAAAAVRAKLARLKQADRSWERIGQLRRENAIAQQEADDQQFQVETLRAEYEAAQAQLAFVQSPARADEVRTATARVRAAEAELELARINLDRCTLRAPTNAQILDVNAEPGELTGPAAARPPVVLADTSRLRVRAFIEEFDAPKVAAGMPATVTADGLPGKAFAGNVTRLSPQMSRKEMTDDRPGERVDLKTREIWIDLAGTAEELVVGLRVDVMLTVAPSEEQITP